MLKPMLAACAIATSSFAFAGSDEFRMTYSSADFADAQTVEELYQRVRTTAREHCPGWAVSRSLADRASCMRDVTAQLVDGIDHPLLTARVHGEQTLDVAAK